MRCWMELETESTELERLLTIINKSYFSLKRRQTIRHEWILYLSSFVDWVLVSLVIRFVMYLCYLTLCNHSEKLNVFAQSICDLLSRICVPSGWWSQRSSVIACTVTLPTPSYRLPPPHPNIIDISVFSIYALHDSSLPLLLSLCWISCDRGSGQYLTSRLGILTDIVCLITGNHPVRFTILK